MWSRIAKHSSSPYLTHSARLGDVIAAIQVLGPFPFHAIIQNHWGRHFGTALSSPDGKWDAVFTQHPEFFRLIEPNGDVASRWRFAFERTYNPRTNIHYTPEERHTKLTEEQRNALDRTPLRLDQVSALLNLAVELHARALAQAQDVRWKLQAAIGFFAGLLVAGLGAAGAVIAALVKD